MRDGPPLPCYGPGGDRVNMIMFTLDEKNARYQKARPDFVVRVGYDEIEPQDVALLRQTLNLTEQAIEVFKSAGMHAWKNEVGHVALGTA